MSRGIEISLCMIVKNEEDVLARCLESVKGIADEINIVDTGSSDTTKEIAKRFTNRVFDFEWIDDFAKARNFAFSKATKDYILWLDADDVFLEADRRKFVTLKKQLDRSIDSVSMVYALARDPEGRATFSLRRNRLVKREKGFKWIGPVHEYLEVSGNILMSDVEVTHASLHHDSNRNLRIYEQRLAQGEEFSPRDMYYYANELKDHGRWDQAVAQYEKFIGTNQWWLEDCIAACQKMYECSMEMGRKDDAYRYLLRSFTFDLPRPFFCCRMADLFFDKQQYNNAAFWYLTAIDRKPTGEQWGPQSNAFWTWIPYLQLCVCYDRLNQPELAAKYNEMAAKYLPTDDHRITFNRKFFAEKYGEAFVEAAAHAAMTG